jgi:hypothetical protein
MYIRTVGVVGLGNMGLGMAATLVRAGFVVIGTDVNDGRRALAEAAGVRFQDSLTGVLHAADALVFSLPYARDVEAVATAPRPGPAVSRGPIGSAPRSSLLSGHLGASRLHAVGDSPAPLSSPGVPRPPGGRRKGHAMQRRDFLRSSAGAAVLAAPATSRGQAAQRLLRFAPQADLAILDPITTTGFVTRNHAFLVFDTLYGWDDAYRAQPQMLEGHTVEDDGRTWTMTLREGLRFHDGEPVRARDVVASLRRWGARDQFGLGRLCKRYSHSSSMPMWTMAR